MAHALNAPMHSASAETSKSEKPSFFRRLVNAVIESRYQSAMRELRRHRNLTSGLSAYERQTGFEMLPFRSAADK
jgi:hypothetical protein